MPLSQGQLLPTLFIVTCVAQNDSGNSASSLCLFQASFAATNLEHDSKAAVFVDEKYQAHSQACYEYNDGVPKDGEGSPVGKVAFVSFEECQNQCSETEGCTSFTACPSRGKCWLKNKVITADLPEFKSKFDCRYYYQTTCSQETPEATLRPATIPPTVAPTSQPTPAPTIAPTTQPSPVPTLAATATPTSQPTPAPTPTPTAAPTLAPTSQPTPVPTLAPTTRPTSQPTLVSTLALTSQPTAIPTTIAPTLAPTQACRDEDDEGTATDSHGDTCSDYVEQSSWCGKYDDSDFTSEQMCCACSVVSCYDIGNTVDMYGDGCSMYSDDPSFCGDEYDDRDFTANVMCCGCGGGSENASVVSSATCMDIGNSSDPYGDTCTEYNLNIEWCGLYDDTDFFSAVMCCGCGGGTYDGATPSFRTQNAGECIDIMDYTDRIGDACEKYYGNSGWCGKYDDIDFVAAELCCACGGGQSSIELGGSCFDIGDDQQDSNGHSCAEYTTNPDWCGKHDDSDFISESMCCQCGGGQVWSTTNLNDPSLSNYTYMFNESSTQDHIDFARIQPDRFAVHPVSHIVQTTRSRPTWMKTLRCKNETEESCEECSGGKNCLVPGDEIVSKMFVEVEQEVVVLTAVIPYTWNRFLALIHVKCPTSSSTVKIHMQIDKLDDGDLNLYWDGAILGKNFTSSYASYLASPARTPNSIRFSRDFPVTTYDWHPGHALQIDKEISLPESEESGHELTVEVKVREAANIPEDGRLVEISRLWIYESGAFTYCQDSKMCLKVLEPELRNSNKLQLQCLNGSLPEREDCTDWRECLSSGSSPNDDVQQNLIKILQASLGASSDEVHLGATLGMPLADEQHCMDPRIEDPESWACDCYEKMQQRCEAIQLSVPSYDESLCLRTQFCAHEPVCTSWKNHFCIGLQEYQSALFNAVFVQESISDKFVARAESSERASELEKTTRGKGCV